ncbi:conserved hypothetical protein [Sulfolobus islandicus Y.G.57.14]|jgi:hypothetical protein|uniref:Uncharacterized protein n=7 Tax=Saccharolobus islandicus TaxID=43080 RepID=M9U776_SACIS|nr:hypothetical protein [Sulfolobus islandicus]ACP34580.1 conserved hypothetical protein [Sulfolobus islandicus L.S.2.15]ACP44705.1 conserved hypothetical protein [Sulfolobus islandicus Y.G.57.14]ACP49532.1 conserved hypothetical protein [Sulfolobus islandicus Y.N.15.51]ADB86226.1 conserved hypothetical protein [Sulfolobus islandicus L.D.8.5]ADX82219.1 conserved hypothetical protein [Sulfolobus islandicus HVE10/4]
MPIIVRKVHKKADGSTIWIRVGESPPVIKDGNVIDGGFFIRIGDDKSDKIIRLSDQEALDIAYRIIEAYRRHVRIFTKLDELSYEQYKKSKEVVKDEEEDEEEIEKIEEKRNLTPDKIEAELIDYLTAAGGETTLDKVREDLGEEYAAYLRTMKNKGIIIEGTRVKLGKNFKNT